MNGLPSGVIAATLRGAGWEKWLSAARRQTQKDGQPPPGPWETPAPLYLLLACPYTAYREPVAVSGYYPASNRAYHETKRLARELGGRAHPMIPLKVCAEKAGLALFGDNGLALAAGCGSRAVLTAIAFEDASALPDIRPPAPPPCFHCGKCAAACPTGAIQNGIVDRSLCLSAATLRGGIQPEAIQEKLNGRIHGCDACQAVCPLNAEPQDAPEDFRAVFAPEKLLFGWDKRQVADLIGANLAQKRLMGGLAALDLPKESAKRACAHEWPEVRAHAAASLWRRGEYAFVEEMLERETDEDVIRSIWEAMKACPRCTERP